MSPESRVRAFCEAFSRREPRELLTFLAPDCVYHNIPMPPLRGHAAIEPVLAAFLRGTTRVEFEVLALAATGACVLTERLDRFEREDGRRIELPVMGAFEVGGDGRITAWRDYFDLGMWTRQAGG